jgi:hypothetical protein
VFDQVLLYAGACFAVLWGIAHLFPTRSVVDGFGELSVDNRRIITMEWIVEGVALVGLGSFVIAATLTDHESPVAVAVYWVATVTLVVLAVVSIFTGARIRFLPFRLCPVIFTIAAVLIGAGATI